MAATPHLISEMLLNVSISRSADLMVEGCSRTWVQLWIIAFAQ